MIRLFVPVMEAWTVTGPAKRLLPVADVVVSAVNVAVDAEVTGAVLRNEMGPAKELVIVVDVKLQFRA